MTTPNRHRLIMCALSETGSTVHAAAVIEVGEVVRVLTVCGNDITASQVFTARHNQVSCSKCRATLRNGRNSTLPMEG